MWKKRSNVEAFILRPAITAEVISAAASVEEGVTFKNGEVKIVFNPKVGKKQSVLLLLNEMNPPSDRPARAYSFNAPKDNGITDSSTAAESVNVSYERVVEGDYLVRVQVDEAESVLELDTDGKFFSPMVTI